MRVFLDTNLLVSAVATRGICADVFREVLLTHKLVISKPLLDEVTRILETKLKVPELLISEFVKLLCENSHSVDSRVKPDNIKIDVRDQNDIIMLNSVLIGETEIFVTGDKELLTLEQIRSVRIISPRQFWELIRG